MLRLVDMHCHPSFLSSPRDFARQAEEAGLGLFATTVTPDDYQQLASVLEGAPNVRVGVGLHPWWVAGMEEGSLETAGQLCQLVRETRYVGEVGLDFGKRWEASKERQLKVFARIAAACGAQGGKLLSVHAVKSANAVLDVLQETGCLGTCDVVFHWYSDSSAALTRAIRAGCYFSVNMRMLATKRGREYARVIPADRLLLETDLPPENEPEFGLAGWTDDLRMCLDNVEKRRAQDVSEIILKSSFRLLNW